MNPRGIHLPEQVWLNLQLHADLTNSFPKKGTKRNTPSITAFLRRIGEDNELLQAISDYLNQPKNQQNFNIETIVIRPISVKTETIAHVIISDNLLMVIFTEKRDDFKATIKETLGFRWNGEVWQRQITVLNGSITDRAAETAHQLLSAGFCVICPNNTIQKNALTGNYMPEIKCWIMRKTVNNLPVFWINWQKPYDFYKRAMLMTGAKYHDGIVTVPFEHFSEVEDFANLHHFQFTEAALELLNIAKSLRANAITVDVKEIPQATDDFERPILKIMDDASIDNELLDD